MAYGRNLKPAIYADLIAAHIGRTGATPWELESGSTTLLGNSSLYQLSDGVPKVRLVADTDAGTTDLILHIDFGEAVPVDAIAVLNHNLNTAGSRIEVRRSSADNYGLAASQVLTTLIGSITSSALDHDGSHIVTLGGQKTYRHWWVRFYEAGASFTDDIEIGQLCLLRKWTAPHGPDMGGRRPLDFSGVKLVETVGGGHNAVVDWMTGSDAESDPFGQPFRYDHAGAGSETWKLAGRRRWQHTLSLLDDDDVFNSDAAVSITDGDATLAEILAITGGPRHPFIFTPDSTSTTVGDYWWARLLNSSIEPEEASQHVLTVDLDIQEEF